MSIQTGRLQRFLHWLFGSPFEEMSTAIGDPVPPELQAFDAEVEHMQHQLDGDAPSANTQHTPAQGHRH